MARRKPGARAMAPRQITQIGSVGFPPLEVEGSSSSEKSGIYKNRFSAFKG